MDQRVAPVGLIFLMGCAGSALSSRSSRVAGLARAESPPRSASALAAAPSSVHPLDSASAPLERDPQADSDRNYLENTERAVALYRQFIERVGTDPQFAAAVKRSRERILDLTNIGIFVREGMAERAGK